MQNDLQTMKEKKMERIHIWPQKSQQHSLQTYSMPK